MNINDIVTVILTDYGQEILNNYRIDMEKYSGLIFSQYTPDKNGKYSTELWNIMFIFGKHISMSQKQIFLHNKIYLK